MNRETNRSKIAPKDDSIPPRRSGECQGTVVQTRGVPSEEVVVDAMPTVPSFLPFYLPTFGSSVGAGHSIGVPKTRPHDSLFGVSAPLEARDAVMALLAKREIPENQSAAKAS